MNTAEMLEIIDFSLRDYDVSPDGIEYIEREDRILWCTGLGTPLANRVVKAVFSDEEASEKIKEIREFFEIRGVPFSWWVGPGSGPADLPAFFREAGIQPEDIYEAAVWNPDGDLKVISPPEAVIADVESEEDIRDLVSVNAAVWAYGEGDLEHMVKERLAYLYHPQRRGGFVLARVDGKAAAAAHTASAKTGKRSI